MILKKFYTKFSKQQVKDTYKEKHGQMKLQRLQKVRI